MSPAEKALLAMRGGSPRSSYAKEVGMTDFDMEDPFGLEVERDWEEVCLNYDDDWEIDYDLAYE